MQNHSNCYMIPSISIINLPFFGRFVEYFLFLMISNILKRLVYKYENKSHTYRLLTKFYKIFKILFCGLANIDETKIKY